MRISTTRRLGRTLLLCLALLIAFAGPAAAAEKSPAEQLHTAAVQAYKRGNLRQAIELWSDALRLEPSWKYAYNLANVQYERGDAEAAWVAVRRAEALGPPPKHVAVVLELQGKVRALLFKDHAWLVIDAGTLPAGAVVTRDNEPLAAPYDLWTTQTESVIEISAEGFELYHQKVTHPIGERTELKPRLVPLSAVVKSTGRLAVTGPAGATLWVGGVERGHLPIEPIELAVGSSSVRLELKGFITELRDVTIAPDQVTPLDLQLRPVVVVKPPSHTDLAMPGWIIAGSGVVLASIGAGCLVWAGDTKDELDALNTPAALAKFATYDDYVHAFEAKQNSMDDRALAGQILVVAGGVAIVTGIALLLIEDGDDEAPDGGVLGVVPITGGAALVGGAKF